MTTKPTYRYKTSQMHASSDKYGMCEVCGMSVTDVYYQSEARQMASGRWTHLGCKALFGHSTCLEGARR